jgi:hypothetical protein
MSCDGPNPCPRIPIKLFKRIIVSDLIFNLNRPEDLILGETYNNKISYYESCLVSVSVHFINGVRLEGI